VVCSILFIGVVCSILFIGVVCSILFIEIERQSMPWTARRDFARSLIYP
jgi:hypothetical protein